MTDALHRLVYYSRNRLEGDADAVARDFLAILAKSQANNARVGVTGALMFNAGCFAQVLEGAPAAVEATFERIQQDERHGDVSLLGFGPAPGRSFPNWSMGFVGASEADAARYGAIGGASGFDPSRMSGERLHQTLFDLVMEEERAAA